MLELRSQRRTVRAGLAYADLSAVALAKEERRTPNYARQPAIIVVRVRERQSAVALAAGQWDIGRRPMPINPMPCKHKPHPSND